MSQTREYDPTNESRARASLSLSLSFGRASINCIKCARECEAKKETFARRAICNQRSPSASSSLARSYERDNKSLGSGKSMYVFVLVLVYGVFEKLLRLRSHANPGNTRNVRSCERFYLKSIDPTLAATSSSRILRPRGGRLDYPHARTKRIKRTGIPRDNWTWNYSKLASYVSKFHATLGKETARTLTIIEYNRCVSFATRSGAANRDGSSLEREFRHLRANRRGFALDMRERAKFAFLTAQRTAGKAVRQGGEAKLAQTS